MMIVESVASPGLSSPSSSFPDLPFTGAAVARARDAVLAEWRPDADWHDAFATACADVDVVSFDVFDTALTRVVETPVDVFALVEKELIAAHGRVFRGFAERRERAEKVARVTAAGRGVGEVTFAEILAALVGLESRYRDHVGAIEAMEIAVERAVLVPVPEMRAAVAHARAAGRKVVFLSDMYHARDVIHGALVAAGYPADCAVIVSSESGCTKSDGGLWAVLRAHLTEAGCQTGCEAGYEAARVLHVGDNAWSDIDRARAHGNDALPFFAALSCARRGGPLSGDIVPYSLQARVVRLGDRPPALRLAGREDVSRGDMSGRMRALGRSWGAVVVGSYVRWIARRAQAIGVRRVFFCARDGWLPIQVWNAWNLSEKTGIPASYLHVSRRALNFAAAAAISTPTRLATEAVETLIRHYGHVSLGDLLARNGVRDDAALVADAGQHFGGLDRILTPEDDEALRALFRRHPGAVYAALSGELDDAARYLLQEGVGDGAVAFVDVGWNGTLQSASAHILRHAGKTPRLYGLYCGLWNDAQIHRGSAGWMEAAFGSDFIHDPEQYGLRNAIDILENLLGSEDGTTIGYVEEGGRMVPRRAEGGETRAQFDAVIRPFQAGVIEVLQGMVAEGHAGPLQESCLSVEAGLAAIGRLSVSPTPSELAAIGSILHASDMSHRALAPLVPELGMDDPETASHTFRYRSWPLGSALALLGRLEGEAREAVCSAVRDEFAHFDARTKEQFQ